MTNPGLMTHEPSGDLAMIAKPLELAAQGYLQQNQNAVPIEKEKTARLEMLLQYQLHADRGLRHQEWGVLLIVGLVVAAAIWKDQWAIVTHLGAGLFGLMAGRYSVKAGQTESQSENID